MSILGAGYVALKLVAALCWAAAVIRKKNLEADMIAEQIKDYKISNEARKEILDARNLAINTVIEAEANAVLNSFDIPNQSENLERLKLSIKTFEELMSKGAEFRPSLTMNECH